MVIITYLSALPSRPRIAKWMLALSPSTSDFRGLANLRRLTPTMTNAGLCQIVSVSSPFIDVHLVATELVSVHHATLAHGLISLIAYMVGLWTNQRCWHWSVRTYVAHRFYRGLRIMFVHTAWKAVAWGVFRTASKFPAK